MAKKIENEEEKKYRENVEQIAGNIEKLAGAVKALLNGPLKRQALIILLAHSSGQSQRATMDILKALENLEADWVNKK